MERSASLPTRSSVVASLATGTPRGPMLLAIACSPGDSFGVCRSELTVRGLAHG
jgi:hypothetical protein